MIIDAHMHVWKLSRGDYEWLTPDLTALYRDFDLSDIANELEQGEVGQVILVQAAASAAETDYLLDIARSDPRVAGVVGWVDFEARDAAEMVEARAREPLFLGVRPMIADLSDPDWILERNLDAVFEALIHNDLVFEGHGRADLIRRKTELARRYPQLKIVLDHAGKPPIAAGDLDQWQSDLAGFASHANAYCKLSGLLTEAGDDQSIDTLSDVTDHIFACFGASRVLWGSDWPVLVMAGDYLGWLAQAKRLTKRQHADRLTDVFKQNALRVYGLARQREE